MPVSKSRRAIHDAALQALGEVREQLELDVARSGANPVVLGTRARAVRQARAAGDEPAYRQALLDLASCCVALAAELEPPRRALADGGRPSVRRAA
jgi:histidine ammonia-lyase